MISYADSFVEYLQGLVEHDRGGMAALRRSLGFAPGCYPPAYPIIERFAAQGSDKESLRKALYLTAGLFALHPSHAEGRSLASTFGQAMRQRESPSIEKRFIATLSAEAEALPDHLRQVISLLAADGIACDYGELLGDLSQWLNPRAFEARDRIRQRWAREFYRTAMASDPPVHESVDTNNVHS